MYFVAPECRGKKPQTETAKADIWSVGAILYLLVTGGQLDYSIKEKFNFKEPVWKMHEPIKNFIANLVQRDPSKRQSATQLLEH